MGALPLEVIEFIIDELRPHYDALHNCSLVCKSWLPRSSKHLFRSFRVPNPYYRHAALLLFCDSVLSSARMFTSIEILDVTVDPSTIAKVALLVEHLPALQSLTVSATVLERRAYPPTISPVRRHIEHLQVRSVSMDTVAYFLGIFASASSLEIRRCTGKAGLGPVPRTYRVRRLAIADWDGPTLRAVSRLVEPSTLESVLLDVPVIYPPPSVEDVSQFFRVLGAHVRELEYCMDPFFKVPPLVPPALHACPLLESFIVTTPREARFNHASWRTMLGPLSSLPSGVRAVRLCTNCGAHRGAQDARDVLRTLDWNAVGRALEHLNTLERLQVEACDFNDDVVSLAQDRDVQEDILGKLPGYLRSRTVFR